MKCSGIWKPYITLLHNQNSNRVTNISHMYVPTHGLKRVRDTQNAWCVTSELSATNTLQPVIRSTCCKLNVQVSSASSSPKLCSSCRMLYNDKYFKSVARGDNVQRIIRPRPQSIIRSLSRKVARLSAKINKVPEPPAIMLIKDHIHRRELSDALLKLRGVLNYAQTSSSFETFKGRLSFSCDILESLVM